MKREAAVVILGPSNGRADPRGARHFGPDEARELERVLLQSGAERVTLDVSEVVLDDAAIGHLARALQGVAARVEVRGLSRHQRRMLRYLGVADRGTPGKPHAFH